MSPEYRRTPGDSRRVRRLSAATCAPDAARRQSPVGAIALALMLFDRNPDAMVAQVRAWLAEEDVV